MNTTTSDSNVLADYQDLIKIPREPNIILKEFATDSLEKSNNKNYFKNNKKEITYAFNTHGYRDDEWPTHFENIVWCLGDSATLGVGQPFEETWPQVLQKMIKKRCINIGQEGCSNDTLRLRAELIAKKYKPANMVIMWTFFSRRRKNGIDVRYDQDDFGMEADLKNFAYNFSQVEKLNLNLVHLVFPNSFVDLKKHDVKVLEYLFTKFNMPGKDQVKKINFFEQVDNARDNFHFGASTSQNICNTIRKQLS